MSIVSVLATTKYISVMTDGRITGDDGNVSNELYRKVEKLNENTFIAFTGRCELFEELLWSCNTSDFNNYEDVTKCIYEKFMEIDTTKKLSIVIGGKDENNEIGYYFFSNFGHELTQVKPSKDNELDRVLLVNASFGIEKLLDILLNNIGFNTDDKAIAIQKIIHDYQAEYDISVNSNKYHVIIKK